MLVATKPVRKTTLLAEYDLKAGNNQLKGIVTIKIHIKKPGIILSKSYGKG